MQRTGLTVALTSLAVCGVLCAADQPAVEIRLEEAWSDFFSDQTVRLHFVLTGTNAFSGRVAIGLVAEGGRVLWRDEADVRSTAGRPQTFETAVPLPPVKGEVVLPLVLEARAFELGAREPAAGFCRHIWTFPQNPFTGRKVWLEKLAIALYDPLGSTAEVFQNLGVPFQRVYNPAVLAERTTGLIVVGEGISWRSNRGLPKLLDQAAVRGVPALSLAPADGQMVLPGTDEDGLQPAAIILRRPDVMNELDKRLDSEAWPPDGRLVASSLALRGRGSIVVAEEGRGWPWLEIRYPGPAESNGRLLVCGFAIIDKWDATPAPRFLLARLLEYLTAQPDKQMVVSRQPAQPE